MEEEEEEEDELDVNDPVYDFGTFRLSYDHVVATGAHGLRRRLEGRGAPWSRWGR